MSEVWPSSLPQCPLIEGFSDTPIDTVVRSEFSGYTKVRNRFTATIHEVTENYLLTIAQYNIFLDFFESALSNGSVEFTKPDPVKGATSTYRFTGPYSSECVGVYWRVELNLEKLP